MEDCRDYCPERKAAMSLAFNVLQFLSAPSLDALPPDFDEELKKLAEAVLEASHANATGRGEL